MKAIVLSYVVGQNEPSTPQTELVDVPYKDEHFDFMKALFEKIFDYDEPEDLELSYGHKSGYGDINIGDGDCFIYLTYVKDS